MSSPAELVTLSLTPAAILLGSCGAFCLGVSKAGVPALALVNVLVMAEIFGARASVGIVLPLLIVCDIIVYPLFRRHANWREVWPILVPCLLGVAASSILLGRMDDTLVRRSIGTIILAMLTLLWLRPRIHGLTHLHDAPGFRWAAALAIGISTMMANAAGPIYSIYGLVRRLEKRHFLGLGARLFLLLNILKLPFGWGLGIISPRSLAIDLTFIPAILAGILFGRRILEHIDQRLFERLLFFFALAAAGRMLLF